MTVAEPKIFQAVTSFLDRQKLDYSASEEQHCTKLTVKTGATGAYVNVYNSGKMHISGKESTLKALLLQMKKAIEADTVPVQALPFEIEKFPDTIRERVPECDPVIVGFVEEAIRCIRSEALLAGAFMLGAASEKAINLLVYAYAEAIQDERHRNKFLGRVNNRMISKKYEDFNQSYKSCRSRPTDAGSCWGPPRSIGVAVQIPGTEVKIRLRKQAAEAGFRAFSRASFAAHFVSKPEHRRPRSQPLGRRSSARESTPSMRMLSRQQADGLPACKAPNATT